MKFPSDYIIHCEPNEKGTEVTMSGWEELIRCKDCKFRITTKNRHKNKERIYCRLFFDPIEHHYYRCKDGDFCSRGERREK